MSAEVCGGDGVMRFINGVRVRVAKNSLFSSPIKTELPCFHVADTHSLHFGQCIYDTLITLPCTQNDIVTMILSLRLVMEFCSAL